MNRMRFSPSLWPTLATLVLLPFLVSLGAWQLGRADEKRALIERFEAAGAVTVTFDSAAEPPPRYQRVRVSGEYLEDRQFLLDAMAGSAGSGVHVLSILQLPGDERGLLVNRGWRPPPVNRARPEAPPLPMGPQVVTGRLNTLPRPGIELDGGVAGGANWPRLVLFPEMDELARVAGVPLYPRVLLLDDDQPGGFERNWSPVNFGPDRHIAYAVQWFGLALALLVIYVVVNLSRKEQA